MLKLRAPGQTCPTYLIASTDSVLSSGLREVLCGMGIFVGVARSADAALEAVNALIPPDLVLLDAALPGLESDRMLTAMRAESESMAIVAIADGVEVWKERLKEGVIADLVLRQFAPGYIALRLERVVQWRRLEGEFRELRETAARDAQHDRLTGLLNREALLAALFRETDRAQRMGGSLSVILFDIDDFGHWNSRLGPSICDQLLCQVPARAVRLLRSYDLLGRTGKDEFLIGLPGCGTPNAVMLAERLRNEVFAEPFHVGGDAIRLSACFGIVHSLGRSPVIVLREAEKALARARAIGPESIQFGSSTEQQPPPVTFLSPTSGEELVAW